MFRFLKKKRPPQAGETARDASDSSENAPGRDDVDRAERSPEAAQPGLDPRPSSSPRPSSGSQPGSSPQPDPSPRPVPESAADAVAPAADAGAKPAPDVDDAGATPPISRDDPSSGGTLRGDGSPGSDEPARAAAVSEKTSWLSRLRSGLSRTGQHGRASWRERVVPYV